MERYPQSALFASEPADLARSDYVSLAVRLAGLDQDLRCTHTGAYVRGMTTRTRFPLMAGTTDTFVVEDHAGSTVVSPGRVARFGNAWSSLPVAGRGWTPFRSTRREAVADLRSATFIR